MIDLTQNSITLNQTYPETKDTFFIEGDVIIPDIKPDVESILFVDAIPIISDYSVNSGQITLTGNCEFNILYVSENMPSEIIRISTSIPFKTSFAASNLTSESHIKVSIKPVKVSSLILNGRKISVSAELEALLKHSNQNQINYIESVGENPTVNQLQTQQTIPIFLNSTQNSTQLKDTAMLNTNQPNIKDILKYESTLENEECIISDGKIIIKAGFNIKIYYTSDGSSEIYTFETSLPFSNFINIKDVSENSSCETTNTIKNVSLKLLPDSDDLMRVIEFDVMIDTDAKVIQNNNINVIEDIYDTTKDLIPQREDIYYETTGSPQSEEISLRGTISIPTDKDIKILSSFGRIKSLDLEKDNENSRLKGIIDVTVIYSTPEDGKIASVALDMPLEHILSSDIDILESAEIEKIEVTSSGNEKYDVKITLKIKGYKNSRGQISLLRDIIEMEDVPIQTTGLTIYFVKPGDTLWKIAKKFRTTVENIVKLNNIDNPDMLHIGKALVI